MELLMKTQLQDLAILGGSPTFEEPLHVGRPNLGDLQHFLAQVSAIFERHWLSNNGPLVQQLEARLAAYLGVRHCIATCNGTVALELAIRAMGMTGEVIVPSFTFVATAHALQWQGLSPVFCDVDPHSHNLDPRVVERLITVRTGGIVGVHLWGRPCAVEALAQIAERHGLPLLFDASHAFGASHRSRMLGNFGDAEVFSFHATKVFNTFEGGAVTTNCDALAQKIRAMRCFGFDGGEATVCVGTNGKMSECAAAMGLSSFEALDGFIAHNRRNYHLYREALDGVPGIRVLPFDPRERSNYHYVVLTVEEGEAHLSRDQLMQLLQRENVLARRYFYPGCHRMEPYRSEQSELGRILPRTEELAQRVLVLPNGTGVSPEQALRVAGLIHFAVQYGEEISALMAGRSAVGELLETA
jgi:dTDP-4-amino-4,6-dideoxygalactose transaminase